MNRLISSPLIAFLCQTLCRFKPPKLPFEIKGLSACVAGEDIGLIPLKSTGRLSETEHGTEPEEANYNCWHNIFAVEHTNVGR